MQLPSEKLSGTSGSWITSVQSKKHLTLYIEEGGSQTQQGCCKFPACNATPVLLFQTKYLLRHPDKYNPDKYFFSLCNAIFSGSKYLFKKSFNSKNRSTAHHPCQVNPSKNERTEATAGERYIHLQTRVLPLFPLRTLTGERKACQPVLLFTNFNKLFFWILLSRKFYFR